MAAKENVTQLDVILEAIRYIDNLQAKLVQKIENGEILPVLVNSSQIQQRPALEDIAS